MRSSERFALLAFNTVVALMGAAVMFVLVRATTLDSVPLDPRDDARAAAPEVPYQPSRLAFVAPGALLPSDPTATDQELRAGTEPETGELESWSTETRAEATKPPQSFTQLPSMRLPWQSTGPAARQRVHTLKTRLAEISPGAGARLAAKFEAVQAAWPPTEIALIAIKDEKVLELHARARGTAWKRIHRYRVLAASGGAGPKLRQGDRQVPEGIYSIAFLNPNSAYHVSLRVNYPNAFDRQMAAKDARKDLGGDIMIHGKNLSAGCLAMGDEAVEEIFLLAAQTGLANVKLIIAPTDLRERELPPAEPGRPEWLPKLYTEIATAMADFKAPPSKGLLSFLFK